MKAHGLLSRRPLFSPSVGRFAQGMLVQVPLHLSDLNGTSSLEEIHATLDGHYAGAEAVEVVGLAESSGLQRLDPTELAGTDRLRLFVLGTPGEGQANLVASLDNLGKGASGAAVQNLALMLAQARAGAERLEPAAG
jgi:N-acetyl-gamma-glutamyl-phosphate reductase